MPSIQAPHHAGFAPRHCWSRVSEAPRPFFFGLAECALLASSISGHVESDPPASGKPLEFIQFRFRSSAAGHLSPSLAAKAELARIGRYYATESMLVLNPETGSYDIAATPSTGTEKLFDFYKTLIVVAVAPERGDHAVFRRVHYPPGQRRKFGID